MPQVQLVSVRRGFPGAAVWRVLASPVVLIFLSSNFVNAGNLAFNMVFSRWTGPALFGDLAMVLTIKLALLGLLGAVQMAVTRHVATFGARDNGDLLGLAAKAFVLLWFVTPVVMLWVGVGGLGTRIGMMQPQLLVIVLLSLPFAAPLAVCRGIVQGKMDVAGILLSANVEMLVRLVGAIGAWQLGFGANGVAIAIGLSIFSGWAAIATRVPKANQPSEKSRQLMKTIGRAVFPFAVLQASQVLLLDGDIFAAKILFDEMTAGYVAALGLFQRIEFFACFGLAAVLLPAVADAATNGKSASRAALPVMAVFVAVTLCFVAAVVVAPEALISMMIGAEYLPAADMLIWATLSASAFTLSYLTATYLSALNDFRGIWIIAAFVPLQLGAFFVAGSLSDGVNLHDLMTIKVGCQGALMGLLVGVAALRSLRRA